MPRNKSRWEEFKDGQRRSWNTAKDTARGLGKIAKPYARSALRSLSPAGLGMDVGTAGMDAALKEARAIGAKGSARRGKLPLPGDRKDKEMNRLKLENSRLKAGAAKAKIKAAASSVKGGLSKMGGVISGIAKKTTKAAKKSAAKRAKAKAKALRKEGKKVAKAEKIIRKSEARYVADNQIKGAKPGVISIQGLSSLPRPRPRGNAFEGEEPIPFMRTPYKPRPAGKITKPIPEPWEHPAY